MSSRDDMNRGRLRLLCWALVGLGAILRLRQYGVGRPLWLDESMIALNVLLRSYGGLLHPLDSDQTAPFPFLWAVKLSAALGGTDERVLRIAPFVGGIALLLLMVPLASRILEPRAGALAVGMSALAPLLIYYSNEIKPYGLDAALMALLAVLTLRVLEFPESHRAWGTLWLSAIVAGAAASPVPFCMVGVGAALLVDRRSRSSAAIRLWFPAIVIGCGLVFLALYLTLYRPVAQNAFMQRFWMSHFLDPTLPGFGATLKMALGSGFQDLLMAQGGSWRLTAGLLFLIPMAAGANHIRVKQGTSVMLLCMAPWVAALVASGLRRYPFAPRLMLFSAPLVIVMVAAGVTAISGWLAQRWQRLPWFSLACVALAAMPGLDAVRQWREPLQRESVGLLIPWVEEAHAPGAAIYVPGRTMATWIFYTTDWRAPDTARVLRLSRLVSSAGPAFYLAPTRGDSIRAEGDAYRFRYRDWTEVIGISPGHGPGEFGKKRSLPDPGWSQNEVRRMIVAADTELWLVSSTYYPGYLDPLVAPLEAAGAKIVERRLSPSANVTRYMIPDSVRKAFAGR